MPNHETLLALQIAIQARKPVFLWGRPGSGKTSFCEQVAPLLNERLWTVILSIREPSDQGGLPIIRPDGVTMHPPLWARQLTDVGHGVVFWDEFNTAPPTTQSSALRVITGGWAGDLQLPKATSHVAAGNPPEICTGAYDLTSAIANRWCHLSWPVDPNAWADGMIAGWPAPVPAKLPETWESFVPPKRAIIADFIRRRGELLDQLPDDTASQGRAWPSGRTWEMAADLLAAAHACGHTEKSSVARLCVEGCVGAPAAREFSTWYVSLDLRDPEEYLAAPVKTPLPKRQDQVLATLASVAGAALDSRHKPQALLARYQAAWVLIGRVCRDIGADVAMPTARTLAINMPDGAEKELPKALDDIAPLLAKAKIDFRRH